MIKRCTILLTLLIVSFTGRTQLPDLPWAKEVGAKNFRQLKKYIMQIIMVQSPILLRSIPGPFKKLLTPAPKPAAAL